MADDVTKLLKAARSGDERAVDALLPVVYDELRSLARGYLGRERNNHTLQATALVHEAYLRVIDQSATDWKDRAHFFALAARVMRHVLVDHARKRNADKRSGNHEDITLDGLVDQAHDDESLDVLALDDALTKLAQFDERKCRVVELRYFAGLEVADVAEALGVSKRTAESDWFHARAWLRAEMA